MDFIRWQELSHLKTRLLEIAICLIEDEVISREQIAYDLLMQIENLDDIERSYSYKIRSIGMERLCREIEKKQLEKEKTSTTSISEGSITDCIPATEHTRF